MLLDNSSAMFKMLVFCHLLFYFLISLFVGVEAVGAGGGGGGGVVVDFFIAKKT